MLSVDYSQLELRIIAHLSRDEALIGLLRSEQGDVFRGVAGVVYGKSSSTVTDEERKLVKGVVYGIVYGMSASGIADKLQLPKERADNVMAMFYKRYPGVSKWKEEVAQLCLASGFVETLGGRRRHFPYSKQVDDLAKVLRSAINTLCQGSAADIMRSAMTNVAATLRPEHARMVLQIHDELLVECLAQRRVQVQMQLERCMIDAWSLVVPLRVRISWGHSWGDLSPTPVGE